jgi:hypothetical protein
LLCILIPWFSAGRFRSSCSIELYGCSFRRGQQMQDNEFRSLILINKRQYYFEPEWTSISSSHYLKFSQVWMFSYTKMNMSWLLQTLHRQHLFCIVSSSILECDTTHGNETQFLSFSTIYNGMTVVVIFPHTILIGWFRFFIICSFLDCKELFNVYRYDDMKTCFFSLLVVHIN